MTHHQHEMYLEKTHPSGAEEWVCPTCQRRFLLQWPPVYKKIVLESGDEAALHTGGKGGLNIGPAAVIPFEDRRTLDNKMDAWQAGLRDIDLDW